MPKQITTAPNWETHIVLSRQDLDMIYTAVTRQLYGKPLGPSLARAIRTRRTPDRSNWSRSSTREISCLRSDGTWKIARPTEAITAAPAGGDWT